MKSPRKIEAIMWDRQLTIERLEKRRLLKFLENEKTELLEIDFTKIKFDRNERVSLRKYLNQIAESYLIWRYQKGKYRAVMISNGNEKKWKNGNAKRKRLNITKEDREETAKKWAIEINRVSKKNGFKPMRTQKRPTNEN